MTDYRIINPIVVAPELGDLDSQLSISPHHEIYHLLIDQLLL